MMERLEAVDWTSGLLRRRIRRDLVQAERFLAADSVFRIDHPRLIGGRSIGLRRNGAVDRRVLDGVDIALNDIAAAGDSNAAISEVEQRRLAGGRLLAEG